MARECLTEDVVDDPARLCLALLAVSLAQELANPDALQHTADTAELLIDNLEHNGASASEDMQAIVFNARAELAFLSGQWDDAWSKLARVAADEARAGNWRAKFRAGAR